MKIARFITHFPYPESYNNSDFNIRYPIGGAENDTYYVSKYLRELGHEELIFTTSADSENHIEVYGNSKVFRGATNFSIEKARYSSELFKVPLKYDADIVHIHSTVPMAEIAGYYYAKVKKKPFVITYHGDLDGSFGGILRRLGIFLYNKLVLPIILSDARLIISRSEFFSQQSTLLRKFKNKIISIPCGINPEEIKVLYTKEQCRQQLSLSVDDCILLFVGELIRYRSPNLLIEALLLLLRKKPNISIVFLGRGPMLKDLQELARIRNVSEHVRFAGFVVGDKKKSYYNAADIFILPSTGYAESFGNVILEAASANLPIIVSDLDAFKAFVEDKVTGLVVKAGDINALAEAILLLITKPDYYRKLTNNAFNHLRNYSREAVAKLTEHAYQIAVTK